MGQRATVDHIIPRAFGGTREAANIRVICLECNQAKSKLEREIAGMVGTSRSARIAAGEQLAALL